MACEEHSQKNIFVTYGTDHPFPISKEICFCRNSTPRTHICKTNWKDNAFILAWLISLHPSSLQPLSHRLVVSILTCGSFLSLSSHCKVLLSGQNFRPTVGHIYGFFFSPFIATPRHDVSRIFFSCSIITGFILHPTRVSFFTLTVLVA